MVRSKLNTWIFSAACAATLVVVVSAKTIVQDPVPPATAAQDPADPNAGRGGGRGANQPPRPYAQVVTSAFKSDDGIFKVDRGPINGTDSVLFEIPKGELDKDF